MNRHAAGCTPPRRKPVFAKAAPAKQAAAKKKPRAPAKTTTTLVDRTAAASLIQRRFREYLRHRYDGMLSNSQDLDPVTLEPVYMIPRENLTVWTVMTHNDIILYGERDKTVIQKTRELRGYASTDLLLSFLCNDSDSADFHPGLQCEVSHEHMIYTFTVAERFYKRLLRIQRVTKCQGCSNTYVLKVHGILEVCKRRLVLLYNLDVEKGLRPGIDPYTLAYDHKSKCVADSVYAQISAAIESQAPEKPKTLEPPAKRRKTSAATSQTPASQAVTLVLFDPSEIDRLCRSKSMLDVGVYGSRVLLEVTSQLKTNHGARVVNIGRLDDHEDEMLKTLQSHYDRAVQ
jgi:hypothetical protein